MTDGEIEECMSHLIHFEIESRKADGCVMNHGRCLWTNNEAVVTAYQEKVAGEELKGVDMDNRNMEREWRTAMPERAASEDKRVAARAVPLVLETDLITVPAKKARHYRCSNSLCSSSASAVVRRGWFNGQTKGCSQVFFGNIKTVVKFHDRLL